VVPLVDVNGDYHFLDPIGQPRIFTARELHTHAGIMSLFRGNDAWPRRRFPVVNESNDGEGGKVRRRRRFSHKRHRKVLDQRGMQVRPDQLAHETARA
jgi:hypothetical protein